MAGLHCWKISLYQSKFKIRKDYIEDSKQDKELGISHEQLQVLINCFISDDNM